MRWLSGRCAPLIAAAALAVAASPVRADDLIVLPFQCTVQGGRPVLTPSRDEGHRIIGPREQRNFQACSPANPNFCRQWTVHRFDLDCGGARVAWAAVVASAQSDRAWYERGRLFVRMPRHWGTSSDDRCARGFDPADRWGDPRYGRYCADRWGRIPASVELPPGFAPMLGIDAIFVSGGAPDTSARAGSPGGTSPAYVPPPAAAPPAYAPPPAAAPTAPKVTHFDPPKAPSAEARDVPAKPAAPSRTPAASADAPAALPPPTAAAAPPVVPRIINRPDGPANSKPPTPSVTTVEKAPAAASTPPPPVPVLAKRPPQPEKDDGAEGGPIPVTLMSSLPNPLTASIALMAAITLVFAAFGVMRRREKMQLGATGARDFASVSLDAEHKGQYLLPVPQASPQVPQARMATTPAPRGPAFGDAIPTTRAEALTVLGMGVTPAATQAALKKIVDGLRQSWHPDYAADEADREMRELRLKQINAAWKILAQQQLET